MLFDPKKTLVEQREELQKLLSPISAEAPSGANVRLDPNGREQIRELESLFKNAIIAEKEVEQYQIFPGDSKPEDPKWGQFLDQSLDYLAITSKDLLLATSVTEAAIREFGPRGLLLGIELLTGLVQNFWPNVYPIQDANSTQNRRFAAWRHAYDWPDRVVPKLDVVFKVTAGGTTFAQLLDAMKLDNPQIEPSVREARLKSGVKTTEKIRAEIRERDAYFKNLYADISSCKDAIQKLIFITREKCVSPVPDTAFPVPEFGRINDSLTRMIGYIRAMAWPGLLPEEASQKTTEKVEAEASPEQSASLVVPAKSAQMTREAAFAQLIQLANFFRQTEPHSPVSYAIEQAVRWGNMPLPELLTELIANSDSRRSLFERTGLPTPKSAGE